MSDSMRVEPQWADEHITKLRRGESATFRPRGRSMEPLVMVEPYPANSDPSVGDIVLVTVEGRQYLHKILRIDAATSAVGFGGDPPEYEIGNNRGGVNGWVWREAIHGRCLRNGCRQIFEMIK